MAINYTVSPFLPKLECNSLVEREGDIQWVLNRLWFTSKNVAVLRGPYGVGKTSVAIACVQRMLEASQFSTQIIVILGEAFQDAPQIFRCVLASLDIDHQLPATTDLAKLSDIAQRLLRYKRVLVVLDSICSQSIFDEAAMRLCQAGAMVLLTVDDEVLPDFSSPYPEIVQEVLPLSESSASLLFFSSIKKYSQFLHFMPEQTKNTAFSTKINCLMGNPLALKIVSACISNTTADLEGFMTKLEELINTNHNDLADKKMGDLDRFIQTIILSLPKDVRALLLSFSTVGTRHFKRDVAGVLATALGIIQPGEVIDLLLRYNLISSATWHEQHLNNKYEYLCIHPLLLNIAQRMYMTWPEHDRNIIELELAQHFASFSARVSTDEILVCENSILTSLDFAVRHGETKIVRALCLNLQHFWRDCWRTSDSLRYFPKGIAAAEKISSISQANEDLRAVGELALNYGLVLRRIGSHAAAEKAFATDLHICQQIHDLMGEGVAYAKLANILLRRGQSLEKAESYYRKALIIARQIESRQLESEAVRYLGRISQRQGQFEEAKKYFKEALGIAYDIHDNKAIIWILSYLGATLQALGHLIETEVCYQKALALANHTNDRQAEGFVISFLAELALEQGLTEKAEEIARQSLSILEEVSDYPTIAYVLMFLGKLREDAGDDEIARGLYLRSLEFFQNLLDAQGEKDAKKALQILDGKP